MTREAIIRMAREASEETNWKPALGNEHVVEFMVRFFAIAAAAEREECAKMVEDWDSDSADPRDIATAIRARGNT